MSSFDSLQLHSCTCLPRLPRVRARCVQFVTNLGCRTYSGSQMSGDGNRFAFLFQSRRRNRHADDRGDARLFVVAFDRRGVGDGRLKPQRSRRRNDDVHRRGESDADGSIGEDRRRRSNGSGVAGRCAVSIRGQPRERFDWRCRRPFVGRGEHAVGLRVECRQPHTVDCHQLGTKRRRVGRGRVDCRAQHRSGSLR